MVRFSFTSILFFFFSSRRRHTRSLCDWSSDVCSSDLIFMPSASQGLDGQVTITLGAKGVIECELVSSGERWGRGPRADIHSSNKARVDSPAWRSEEHTSELQSHSDLVCRLLLEQNKQFNRKLSRIS